MTHSVESRFIAIISGAVFIVVIPLFTLFLALSSQQAARNLREHINMVLLTNSRTLGLPVKAADHDSVKQIAVMLAADPNIHALRIRDNSGKLEVFAADAPTTDLDDYQAISEPVFHRNESGAENVGTVTLYVTKPGWFSALHQTEMAFISIFILAILTMFGAAIVGNRLIVIKPLLRLTAAIEATRRLGSRRHVDWISNDEMGKLAISFNQMQTLLEQEELRLKRAHQRMTYTYNRAPAMLFSLTPQDEIAAVSDYWLVATGYERQHVVGLPFAQFVVEEDRQAYFDRKESFGIPGSTSEVTIRFRRADDSIADMLISETDLEADNLTSAGSLCVMTDVTELKQSELRNHQQAISDHLTGLLNRQGFEAELDCKIAAADAAGNEVACIFVDLDRFKSINDNLGHATGDSVLCQFVERILPLLEEDESASRLGGDEFAILVTGKSTERRADELSQKIVDLFETSFKAEGGGVRLSASVGLAFYPRHAGTAAELLQKSDMAMYARKRDGKNGAQVYDPAIMDQTRERAELESDIEVGITASWFEAHFQPIVDIKTGETAGFEALMRMRHPRKGLMPPAGIIKVAEETGTIGQIGTLILEDAMLNLARVSALPGMSDVYVAVNFSPLQFEPGLPMRLASLLSRYQIQPHRLVVEITEAVLMHDNPEIRRIIDHIHEFGCRIALDDFGTGYSSLSYLSRFPVDIVKVDQSFTRSLNDGAGEVARKNRMLIEGIGAISHKMNCKVVAEGVETEEQRSLLQSMGIDYAQGYLFARPREISDLLSSLSVRQALAS